MTNVFMSLLSESVESRLTLRDGLLLDVMLALIVHVIYKTYEPDATLLLVHFGLLILVPLIPVSLVPIATSPSFTVLKVFGIFYTSLTTSIVFYRLSPFHPLARYPGPIVARVSMLWTAYTISRGKVFAYRKSLHDKYGPFVRIGPNEISSTDVSLLPLVFGADGMPKGPAWEGRVPFNPGLIANRDLHAHALLRKRWNRAFSTSSVRAFEPLVWKRATQLVCKVQALSDATDDGKMDLHRWLSYFTTDFMGDMVFNGGFEFMRDGEDKDGLWAMILLATRFQVMIQSFAWLSRLVQGVIFGGRAKSHPFLLFATEKAMARKENGSPVKDLFYHLYDEAEVEKVKPSMDDIILDSALAIVAGADTTSSVLTGVFVYLMSHPDIYKRLQQEIDEAIPLSSVDGSNEDPLEPQKLGNLVLLNAVINETLRLQPALPTFLQRAPAKGSGGKWLREHWLPEKSAITFSPYVLHRDPQNFSPRPDDFWPDRWLQHPGTASVLMNGREEPFVHNTNAFIPFSLGPANCAGKPLSMLEMRVVVTLLMQRFEMCFADGYGRQRWEKELRDVNIYETGDLQVHVWRRQMVEA